MFLESFHQWSFQKHMTHPFLWQSQGWQPKNFDCRKVNDRNLSLVTICNEECSSVNKNSHVSIAKWLHHINFDNHAPYHGKPLICKDPLTHGFIMFKFVLQKLFNILKNKIENSIKWNLTFVRKLRWFWYYWKTLIEQDFMEVNL